MNEFSSFSPTFQPFSRLSGVNANMGEGMHRNVFEVPLISHRRLTMTTFSKSTSSVRYGRRLHFEQLENRQVKTSFFSYHDDAASVTCTGDELNATVDEFFVEIETGLGKIRLPHTNRVEFDLPGDCDLTIQGTTSTLFTIQGGAGGNRITAPIGRHSHFDFGFGLDGIGDFIDLTSASNTDSTISPIEDGPAPNTAGAGNQAVALTEAREPEDDAETTVAPAALPQSHPGEKISGGNITVQNNSAPVNISYGAPTPTTTAAAADVMAAELLDVLRSGIAALQTPANSRPENAPPVAVELPRIARIEGNVSDMEKAAMLNPALDSLGASGGFSQIQSADRGNRIDKNFTISFNDALRQAAELRAFVGAGAAAYAGQPDFDAGAQVSFTMIGRDASGAETARATFGDESHGQGPPVVLEPADRSIALPAGTLTVDLHLWGSAYNNSSGGSYGSIRADLLVDRVMLIPAGTNVPPAGNLPANPGNPVAYFVPPASGAANALSWLHEFSNAVNLVGSFFGNGEDDEDVFGEIRDWVNFATSITQFLAGIGL